MLLERWERGSKELEGGGVNVSYRNVDIKRDRVKREGVEGDEGGGSKCIK